MSPVSYNDFIKNISEKLRGRVDVACSHYATLTYHTATDTKKYDLMKITSRNIGPNDKILLIRAGIHGDEVAGPLTLMRHIGSIFDSAHSHGVKLIMYPLDNPSGFEAGTRYNIENDRGAEGNNDFLRYELDSGAILGDLGCNDTPKLKRWLWSSDPALNVHLPQETIALHNELRELPISQIAGIIDLHQDCYMTIPAAYWYAYGDLSQYHPIVDKIKPLIKVLKNTEVHSGYLTEPDEIANEIIKDGAVVPDPFRCSADENGFIVRHDGSLTDLLFRFGAQHSIVVETTGVTPPEIADEVNLVWIYGIIDLIAR